LTPTNEEANKNKCPLCGGRDNHGELEFLRSALAQLQTRIALMERQWLDEVLSHDAYKVGFSDGQKEALRDAAHPF